MAAGCKINVTRDGLFMKDKESRSDLFLAEEWRRPVATDATPAVVTKEREWLPWSGGICPVPKGTLVDVKLRYGREYLSTPANMPDGESWPRRWIKDNQDGDIIAYRLSEPAEPAQKVEEDSDRDRRHECVEGEPYEYWCRSEGKWLVGGGNFKKSYIGPSNLLGYKFRPVQKEPAEQIAVTSNALRIPKKGDEYQWRDKPGTKGNQPDWSPTYAHDGSMLHSDNEYRRPSIASQSQPPNDMPVKPTPPPGYRLLEKHELTGLRHPDAIVFWKSGECWSPPGITLDGKHGHFFALPITEPKQPTPAEMMSVAGGSDATPPVTAHPPCPDCGAEYDFTATPYQTVQWKCGRIHDPDPDPDTNISEPCPKKPAADKPIPSPLADDGDGWILNTTGTCPVDKDLVIEVRFHHETRAYKKRAGTWDWTTGLTTRHIHSYRLIPDQPSTGLNLDYITNSPEIEPEPNQNNMNTNTPESAQSNLPARLSKWTLVDCGDTETWKVKSAGKDGVYLTRWRPWDSKKLITFHDWTSRTKTQLTQGEPVAVVTADKPKEPAKPSLLCRITKPILKWTFATGTSAAVTAVSILGPTAAKAAVLYWLAQRLGM